MVSDSDKCVVPDPDEGKCKLLRKPVSIHQLTGKTPMHTVSNISFQFSSNSNWTFIALNLPIQEDSKVQQNQKSSRPNFSIQ